MDLLLEEVSTKSMNEWQRDRYLSNTINSFTVQCTNKKRRFCTESSLQCNIVWKKKSSHLELLANGSCIINQTSSSKLKWNSSQRRGHCCQKPKVPTPTCGKCSCRRKLPVLTACVVTGSLSVGEAGQCQGAKFYELGSAALATFPQASHWRTPLWPWNCCRPDREGRAPCTNTCRLYVHHSDREWQLFTVGNQALLSAECAAFFFPQICGMVSHEPLTPDQTRTQRSLTRTWPQLSTQRAGFMNYP